jgi:hypothetical protein
MKKEETKEPVVSPKEQEIIKEEKKIEKLEINEEELMKNLLGIQDFDTSKVK